ncbi:hypothetical protein RB195_004981 [Necator americanus]|uniref:Choline/carnitine acyltransferase domain-containing protein n=1 Tax=Necator americanus TaxID=51031 RepID=A0ABR1BPU7_NECAM
MYWSQNWTAPPTVTAEIDCTERKLLKRLIGYFSPTPSKVATENRLAFLDQIMRSPSDRIVQSSLTDSNWKRKWNTDEWFEYEQTLAEDREDWVELCLRTTDLGEDAGIRIR